MATIEQITDEEMVKILQKKEIIIQRRIQRPRGQFGQFADTNYEYERLREDLQLVSVTGMENTKWHQYPEGLNGVTC